MSIVIALSTVTYTIINYKMLQESKITRKQKVAPLVVAYLKVTENHKIIALYVKNIGEGIAKNVKFNILKDYSLLGDSEMLLSKYDMVESGINNFPPQLEMQLYIDYVRNIKPEDESMIKISITYEDINEKSYTNIFELPFRQVFGLIHSNPPDTYVGQIPFYLQKIYTAINEKASKEDNPYS